MEIIEVGGQLVVGGLGIRQLAVGMFLIGTQSERRAGDLGALVAILSTRGIG